MVPLHVDENPRGWLPFASTVPGAKNSNCWLLRLRLSCLVMTTLAITSLITIVGSGCHSQKHGFRIYEPGRPPLAD